MHKSEVPALAEQMPRADTFCRRPSDTPATLVRGTKSHEGEAVAGEAAAASAPPALAPAPDADADADAEPAVP